MGFLIFLGGAMFGGVFGVAVMCCVQAGSKADENKKDPSRLE